MVQGNSRRSGEVHSASSVLKPSVGTTGATVTSLRLFKPSKGPAVRQDQNRVVPRRFYVPVYAGTFLFYHHFFHGREVDEACSARYMRSRVVPRIFYVPVFLQGRFSMWMHGTLTYVFLAGNGSK